MLYRNHQEITQIFRPNCARTQNRRDRNLSRNQSLAVSKMHVTVAVLSSVKTRIEYFLLEKIEEDDLKDRIQLLLSRLDFVVQTYSSNDDIDDDDDDDNLTEILELAYDIENDLESLPVAKVNAQSQGRIKSLMKRSSSKRLQDNLNSSMRRIDTLVQDIKVRHGGDVAAAGTILRPDHRLSSEPISVDQFEDDTNAARVVIGMEEYVQKVLSLLTSYSDDDYNSSSVISVCGMGGVGKTTLAKCVYDHPRVVKHFARRAWINNLTDSSMRDVHENILIQLCPDIKREEILQMEMMQLKKELYRAQQRKKRFLIVLDDVWSIDTVKFSFPMDRGTRILITTRSEDGAQQLSGRKYYMKLLALEESWPMITHLSGLFHHEDTRFEKIGQHIVKACGGLPLALNGVSCLLRGKNSEKWKEVLNQLQRNKIEVERVLELSYNHLPYHLKPCYLYLGHLRHDQVIPLEKLYSLWMAEGLIPIKDCNSRERMDIAEDYLKQLVDTNLVVAHSDEESGIIKSFKSCQVPDLARDMCVSKGVKENFMQAIDASDPDEINPLMCRFAIYLNHKDGVKVSLSINMPKRVRTLLFFETNEKPPTSAWPEGVDDLDVFQRTKVLGFDGVDFRVKKLPKGIKKLNYLRYLSFQGCFLEELPSFVGNWMYMETLDLRVLTTCILLIPNILGKISSLKHMYFPSKYQTDTKDKLRLDGLINLEILENFNSSVCDAGDLVKFTNLQVLTVIADGLLYDDLRKIIQFVDCNKSLFQLSLDIKNFDCYHSEERLSIFKKLWSYHTLHTFHVEGQMNKLPMEIRMMSSSNVTEIVFEESEFEEDPLPKLGKLQNLRRLVLCKDAIVETSMLCHGSSFLRLTRLELVNLRFLENWVVEEGSMPKLSILMIKDCKKLVMLPQGLDVATLSELKIVSMSQKFQDAIRERVRSLSVSGPILTFYD